MTHSILGAATAMVLAFATVPALAAPIVPTALAAPSLTEPVACRTGFIRKVENGKVVLQKVRACDLPSDCRIEPKAQPKTAAEAGRRPAPKTDRRCTT